MLLLNSGLPTESLSLLSRYRPPLVTAPKPFGVLDSPKNLSGFSPPSRKEFEWIRTDLGDSGSPTTLLEKEAR